MSLTDEEKGLVVNSDNQVVTAGQLESFDNNNDGVLSGNELSGLKYWQDVNKQVYFKSRLSLNKSKIGENTNAIKIKNYTISVVIIFCG